MKEFFASKEFRRHLLLSLSLMGLSIVLLFLLHRKSEVNLMTSDEFVVEAFSDQWESGNSQCAISKKTISEIEYSYVLKNKKEYPYAGVLVRKKDASFFNLEDYKLQVLLSTDKAERLPLRIFNFQEGLSDIKNTNSFRLYQNNYGLEKGDNSLELAFNDFTITPEWWYTLNKLKESEVRGTDLRNVKHFSFFSDPASSVGERRNFSIKELRLVGDYSALAMQILVLCLSVVSLFVIFQFYRYQKNKRIQLTVQYKEDFELGNDGDKNFNALIRHYIAEHYGNSDLKSADLAAYLKVPDYRISDLLKENTGMSFKAFLNHTRVEAAKLYIKNSSYSISEIAYKCGFNSPSSFNRVFKDLVNKSPGEFKG